MFDKKEMLKKELIYKGKLQGFENMLSVIIDRIWATPNCTIACCDICTMSVNTQSKDNSFIQIAFMNRTGEPIEVIWDILHEYGHHLSGMRKANDITLDRENEAWDWAYKELHIYPELHKYIEGFMSYRERCLVNYIKEHENQLKI